MGKKQDYQEQLIRAAYETLTREPKFWAGACGVSPTKFNQSVLPTIHKARCMWRADPAAFLQLLLLPTAVDLQQLLSAPISRET
jgi:hypothetical protein